MKKEFHTPWKHGGKKKMKLEEVFQWGISLEIEGKQN